MLANAAGLGERYTAGDAGYADGDAYVAAWSCAARSFAGPRGTRRTSPGRLASAAGRRMPG